MDVRESPWLGVFHGPQGLTLNDQRKYELGPLPGLAYLHCSPFIDGRLLCSEELPNAGLPVESGGNVDSTGLVNPKSRSSVSNVLAFATNGHLQDLCVASVVVPFGVEFKKDFPLLVEGG